MKSGNKQIQLNLILAVVLIYIVIGSFWCIQIDNGDNVSLYRDYQVEELTEGWNQSVEHGGGSVKQDKDSMEQSEADTEVVQAGDTLVLSRILPQEIEDNTELLFRTDHTYVRVLVDQEVRYSFGVENRPAFGQTPGSIWHLVDLEREDTGKEIRVELMCPYERYAGKRPVMIYGEKSSVILYIFRESFPLFILSVGMILLAFLIFMMSGQIHQILHADWSIYAGIFLLVVGVWSFTESRFMQFVFGRAYAFQMLNFLVFAALPMMTLLVYHGMHLITRGFWSLYIATVLVFFGVTIANFTGIADFFDTLFLIHGMAAVIQVYGAYESIVRTIRSRAHWKVLWYTIAFLEQGFLGGVDIIIFYSSDKFGNGFFYRLGLILFLIIIMMNSMQESYEEQREIIQQELLEKMAYTDSMTGFGNRRAFERDCQELEKKRRKTAIVFMDLNGLKSINDTYGHDMGDWAIRTVADYIKRGEEKGLTCYRLGGDEFCALAQGKSDGEIEELCSSVNRALQQKKAGEVSLSVAYGYSQYQADGIIEIEDVVRMADQQMYERKKRMKQEKTEP